MRALVMKGREKAVGILANGGVNEEGISTL